MTIAPTVEVKDSDVFVECRHCRDGQMIPSKLLEHPCLTWERMERSEERGVVRHLVCCPNCIDAGVCRLYGEVW